MITITTTLKRNYWQWPCDDELYNW